MIIVLIVFAFWIICGLIAYAGTLGYFCREFASLHYPQAHKEDYPSLSVNGCNEHLNETIALASGVFLMGPLGLLATLVFTGFSKGLKWNPWKPEPAEKDR